MGSSGCFVGSREEAAQLVRHAVACRGLHARDEWQRNYCPNDGGSSSDICTDATRGFGLFQIPDGGLVSRFLLPPAEADAARSAGRCAAGQAAAAVGLARVAIEPDYITHARLRDLVRYAGTSKQFTHGFGLAGCGAGLEPGKHLVDELVVVVDGDAGLAATKVFADAVHEGVFGTRALDLGLGEDDDTFTLGDMRGDFARFLDTCLHAARKQYDTQARSGHADCVHVPAPRCVIGIPTGAASMPRRSIVSL